MSEFSNKLKALVDYHQRTAETQNGQKKPQWSTTPYASYAEMLEGFDAVDQNLNFIKLYEKEKKAESSPIAIQMALRVQIQVLGALRRAIRMKMAAGPDARESGALDHVRYDYLNRLITGAKLNQILALPAVNPSDDAIEQAVGEGNE